MRRKKSERPLPPSYFMNYIEENTYVTFFNIFYG